MLGTGCSGCKALFEATKVAVEELKLNATVVKVDDMAKIIGYNVMSLPGLVVDEKVVSTGKKLSIEEVKKLIGANSEELSCPCGANYFCKCE